MKLKRVATATVMAVVVLVTAIGFSRRTQAQTTNQLAGTYRLISYQRTVVATGETTEPMGKAPQGHVIYGRDGRFVLFYVADGRPTPSGLATMTDQERADLFKTMVASVAPISSTVRQSHITLTFLSTRFGRVRTK